MPTSDKEISMNTEQKIQEVADSIYHDAIVTFEKDKPYDPLVVTLNIGMNGKTERARGSIIEYGWFKRKTKLEYEDENTLIRVKLYSLKMNISYRSITIFFSQAVKILQEGNNE